LKTNNDLHIERLTVRAYGLLPNATGQVLLSDELIDGQLITKFPGGGLDLGEGLRECLVREWQEETGITVEPVRHFYTTDFFQRSAFHDRVQVISVYFWVKSAAVHRLSTVDHKSQPHELKGGERFRWAAIDATLIGEVTLPIDRKVAELIVERGVPFFK